MAVYRFIMVHPDFQVVTYLDVMELRDAAAAIWWLGNSGLMNNQLQEAASTFILRRASCLHL